MLNTNFAVENFDEETSVGRRRWDDYTPTPLAPEGADDEEAEGRMALSSWTVWRTVEGIEDLFPSMCAR